MATKSQPEVRRSAKSSNRQVRIVLSQINADHEQHFCHRMGDTLKAESLQPLAENLVSEGQQTPFTVFDSGHKDPKERKVYVLIGGFRRFHALHSTIQKNLDTARIHPEMEVDAIEVVRGHDQDRDEFEKDLLVRSVGENEQRRNFSTEEKLAIVADFQSKRIPAPRAASALAMSETQYGRFVAVVSYDWLHKLVVQNEVGMTDAAELIDLARKKDWIAEFREDLEAWVKDHRELIENERRDLSKVGKKLAGSAEHVKKFIDRKLVQHWIRLIDQKQRFGGKPEFQFGILIDKEKGTITVPGRNFKATELASADLETMIGELQEAVYSLVPIMKERQVVEQARDVSDEDKEKELARIHDDRRQKRAEREKKLRGRPATGFNKAEPVELSEVETEDEATHESNEV